MRTDDTSGPEREQRLGVILAALLEEAEKGQRPDADAVLARHPEFADELSEFFAGRRQLDAVAAPLRKAIAVPTPPTPEAALSTATLTEPTQLGDFRIVREVGRGGMGIVYEAEQISLRRRVALKVLPFAGTLDPRQLQRFRNEAQAAAQLHHTNIVPVHFVGCERGVHYYAMQFIDGQTLARVIADLRLQIADLEKAATSPLQGADTPARAGIVTACSARDPAYFRAVARLAVQAAEALEHAHAQSVIHRDIKPGNLMMDGQRNLWVTDFGLAHCQSQPGLTLTGDLVGTLRYMSPEQALAQRAGIDHRTDVYSLGATLYELLTLEPAFPGGDRQELLRQIAFEEPRRPRRLNRAIPAELETIVLKALEKNPHDRYGTAQEMADDLRRFLEDKPIQARRPSWRQVAVKWARRHKPVVWAAAAVLLMAGVFAGAASLWWTAKRAAAEGEAREALVSAQQFGQEENWPEALRAIRRARAALVGVWADPALHQQIEHLDRDFEMGRRLQEARLNRDLMDKGTAGGHASEAAFSEAFQWYGLDVFHVDPHGAAERISASSIRVPLCTALDDWCILRVICGFRDWKHLAAIAREADPDPWRGRLRDSFLHSDRRILEEVASTAERQDLSPATVVLLARLAYKSSFQKRVLPVLRQARQRHPDDFWLNEELGVALWRHPNPYRYSRAWEPPQGPAALEQAEAVRYLTVAVALRPHSGWAHLNLGVALGRNGQQEEAIAEYRHAIAIDPGFATAHYNLGIELNLKDQVEEAIAQFREVTRLNPNDFDGHMSLGLALQDEEQWTEALAEFRTAAGINPKSAQVHKEISETVGHLHRLDEAQKEAALAVRLDPEYWGAHHVLACVLAEKGLRKQAIPEFRKALAVKDLLMQTTGGQRARVHHNLGQNLEQEGDRDRAMAEYRKAIQCNIEYAGAHYHLGFNLAMRGEVDAAIAELEEAVRPRKDPNSKLLNELMEASALCTLAELHQQKGQFRRAVEEFRRGHKLGSQQPGWPYPSAQGLRHAEVLAALDAKLPEFLQGRLQPRDTNQRLGLAEVCTIRKRYPVAARFYMEILADAKLPDEVRSTARYNGACVATLASSGQGEESARLADPERARLRRQALDWLRAEQQRWARLLEHPSPQTQAAVRLQLQHWQVDSDLAPVRGEAIRRLPESERQAWRRLWAEVEQTLARTPRH